MISQQNVEFLQCHQYVQILEDKAVDDRLNSGVTPMCSLIDRSYDPKGTRSSPVSLVGATQNVSEPQS